MNRMKKMFFASALLFNSILCSCNIKGMNAPLSPVVEVKEGKLHDVVKILDSEEVDLNYLDVWRIFFRVESSKVEVVDNDKLNDSVDYDKLNLEEKLGFRIVYLMLANICIDWLIHNKEINEIYDKERNNDDFNVRELVNKAKKLKDLSPNYVSDYIKKRLKQCVNARLHYRDDSKADQYGILFDDNIFLSSDLEGVDSKDGAGFIFPGFSCEYDKNNATVTFRFFQKKEENTQPMMIVLRGPDPRIISVGVPNYEIFFYDEEGYESMISGNWSWDTIENWKLEACLLSA